MCELEVGRKVKQGELFEVKLQFNGIGKLEYNIYETINENC